MNEKRFSVRLRSECDGVVYSFFDGDKPIDVDMIVDLLNKQQSEINSLKIGLKLSSGEKLFSRRELERKVDEQQEQLDLYKEAILTMLGLLADNGIIFSGVKDE